MDHWISDDSIFISRKSGTYIGRRSTYKHTFPDSPLGDYSFSLIGEAESPSAIAPSVVREHNSYLRLIEFLEFNSAMVTASGHVILRSQIRIAARDGPTTYWRCLDLLPMHAFGLLKPVDTGKRPKFLIVGGDVEKSKYDELDDKYKTLMNSYGDLNDTLTESVLENEKLARDVEACKSIKHERDRIKVSFDALKDEVDELKSTNKREAKKSKADISKLQDQLNNSVTKTVSNELLKEVDRWAIRIAWRSIMESTKWRVHLGPSDGYYRVAELNSKYNDLANAHICGEFEKSGHWKVYRRNRKVIFVCDQLYRDTADYNPGPGCAWNTSIFTWENYENTTRSLYGEVSTFVNY